MQPTDIKLLADLLGIQTKTIARKAGVSPQAVAKALRSDHKGRVYRAGRDLVQAACLVPGNRARIERAATLLQEVLS